MGRKREGEEEKRKRKEEQKKRGEKRKKKRKGEGKKKKINYLFIENIISKLYCLLFLGKENKNDNYIN
jgi:hypothetical protein